MFGSGGFKRISSMNFRELFSNKLYLFDPEQLKTLRFDPEELQKRDILISGYLREHGDPLFFPLVVIHLILIRLPKFKPNDEVRLVIGGYIASGKTSLIKQITQPESYRFGANQRPTLCSDFYTKRYHNTLADAEVRLILRDLSGNEKYRKSTKIQFKTANITMIVYDITNKRSFEYGLDLIENDIDPQSIVALVGNKIDLEKDRKVDKEDARAIAEENGWSYFETTAKDLDKVQALFQDILNCMMYTFPDDELFVR